MLYTLAARPSLFVARPEASLDDGNRSVAGLSTGGGSSAVAASSHAGCERFRLTDPLITRVSRRALAAKLDAPDLGAGIPEARWMRAMTFESLVHSERFVSELLTKAVGQLGLSRPEFIRRRSGKISLPTTAAELASAHQHAVDADTATMLTALALPYPDMEATAEATPVKPDFAIVCPRQHDEQTVGSWLIMGDAKDYERVRSRIDDTRLLKGFLQVALGAASAAAWSQRPEGMHVHRSGALAVPRNAFLQPEALVERLDDHLREVRARADERLDVMRRLGPGAPTQEQLPGYVAHVRSEFDPDSCVTCNLFSYCREELRAAGDPESLLIEIGVERLTRPAVIGLVDQASELGRAPAATMAQVKATVDGAPVWSRRRRTDPARLPGSINVVLAKSDAAALGVHGVAVQRIGKRGARAWTTRTFADPQSPQTRRAVMRLIGTEIAAAHAAGDLPVHLVVPDRPTADLLASAADSLAGVELSRLRWEHDVEMGREPLTFDGQPATIPNALDAEERLAVSFLLEEDRARAMRLRSPVVVLRSVLSAHMVPGGPSADSGRLDYLVRWAEAKAPRQAVEHRAVSDAIAESLQTPGARLSNAHSDAIHAALRGPRRDPERYRRLVEDALTYKIDILERALAVLEGREDSQLRAVHRALEADAQEVWGRRLALQASDLVRFSRTYRPWRNAQVEMLDADGVCFAQLAALADHDVADDLAQDPGTRELALATVVSVIPLRLEVASRRIGDGTTIVALHHNEQALVERPTTSVKIQKGSFKFGQLPIGPLVADPRDLALTWEPALAPDVKAGDRLIVADATWFGDGKLFRSGHEIAVARPSLDNQAAPKPSCTSDSYEQSPDEHHWCCRPHAVVEAEWADTLAERRARGELNPDVWPPLVDEDRFDVLADDTDVDPDIETETVPADLTLDDVD